MTAKTRCMLRVLLVASGIGLVGVAVAIYLTWPTNSLGMYLYERRAREENVRALEHRVATEPDAALRTFYQAWLAEEKGDLVGAIQGFQSLRESTRPGSRLHLQSRLRLGLAYGRNGEPDKELAVYQGLMARYPGASRLSQAIYYLRRGDRVRARWLLKEALEQDARDGSLGSDRQLARQLYRGPAGGGGAPLPGSR